MKLRITQRCLAAAGLFALTMPAVTFGQEETPVPPSGSTFESRMIIAAQDSEGGMPEVQVFSTMDGASGTMFMSDGMMPSQDIFSLANNLSVQKEIELVDDQLQQINKINQEFSKKISEQVKELTSGGNKKGADLSKLINDLNAQKKAQMEGILLPHQFDRLRQISLQMQMKNNGDASALADKQIAEELGLTEEQQERLKARSEEIKKDLEDKIARLKDKAREDLLGELTRDQRKKLEEMTGNKFEMETPNFRERVRQMRRPRDSEKTEDK